MKTLDLVILALLIVALQILSAPAARLIWRDLRAPAWPAGAILGPERARVADTSCEARSLSRRHGAGARCHGDLGAPAVCMLG